MDLLFALGLRLRNIRALAGLKQKDLASELMVPASLLSLFEQGKREPSITFLYKFCNHFHISLSELFAFCSSNGQKKSAELDNVVGNLSQLLYSLEKMKLNASANNTAE